MLATITSAKAPEYHPTQYFEVFGHRSIYHQGWMASAFHGRIPWRMRSVSEKPFSESTWELFDLTRDPTQSRDLSAAQPAKLAEMKGLFDAEALKNSVLPLQNYSYAEARKLPQLNAGRTSITYHEGAIGVPESSLPMTFNRSWQVVANVKAGAGAKGVIAAVGGASAGWSLYLDESACPTFAYRLVSGETRVLKCKQPLAEGQYRLRMAFDYEGPGLAQPVTLKLYVDDALVSEGRIEHSPPAIYTIDETFDVGIDRGSAAGPYPHEHTPGFQFRNGSIADVTISAR
jgi:hypothetical protein